MQWRTLDLCAGETVNRQDPDFGKVMALATTSGPKRACWNSGIAPHNFEGFFRNMGDMLVNAGDAATARKIYASARHSPTYGQWKHCALLEQRIVEVAENVAAFNATGASGGPKLPDTKRLMFHTTVSCMACHQQ